MKFSRKPFFDCFRAFHKSVRGDLMPSQVAAISFLLDHVEKDAAWTNVQHVAYMLSTCAHETAWTFEPIREYRGKTLSAAQKRYWPSGFYGRGYVQLTWDYNYKKAGDKLGIDLTSNPNKVMEPEIAYQILSRGMREGWFTGKKLSNYINANDTDYKNARRIINGVDKAALIAGYAKSIEKCLTGSLETPSVDVAEPQETAKTDAPTVQTPTVLVPQAEPAKAEEPKPSGLKTQWIALVTFATTTGSGLLTWLAGASTPLIYGASIVTASLGVTWMVLRYKKQDKEANRISTEKMERERMAHELTLLQMKSAMSKTDNTVVVVPTPLESSDT